eukprot:7791293-Pyramimonas_sp.AAC.1
MGPVAVVGLTLTDVTFGHLCRQDYTEWVKTLPLEEEIHQPDGDVGGGGADFTAQGGLGHTGN